MSDSYYDTAQICLNGHVVNEMARDYPNSNQKHCSQCGELTTMTCMDCQAPIRGYYHVPGVFGGFKYTRPSYCYQCGMPYPWTQRALEAANEYIADLDQLNDDEKTQLQATIQHLTKDGPQTVVAETRFRKLAIKAGAEVVGVFREILVDVLSESVKKSIFPM